MNCLAAAFLCEYCYAEPQGIRERETREAVYNFPIPLRVGFERNCDRNPFLGAALRGRILPQLTLHELVIARGVSGEAVVGSSWPAWELIKQKRSAFP